MLRQMMVALLAGGHALLEGVPGTAKTLAIRSLSLAMELRFGRVQFTPDLMPTDLTGVNILDETKKEFVYHPGPIFADLLLADEINRAPAKTQAALLEAMQEHQVTAGGRKHVLPEPFFVLATQNPIEQEGTYPLPEAQLDRFLLEIDVGFPDRAAERRMLIATTGAEDVGVSPVLTAGELAGIQRLIRRMPVGEQIVEAILTLVRSARPEVDGDETLRKVQQFNPDLILLDIMMPKISGFEVCKRLRANPATADIVVLMITALDQPSDWERAVEAGTNDFLTKPINKTELLLRVKSALQSRLYKKQLDQALAYIEGVEQVKP
jgi:MoxR-like ATPase